MTLKRDMTVFGSAYMTEICGFCGGEPKRCFPRMCIHFGLDTTTLELRTVQEDRRAALKRTFNCERVILTVCIKCANRLANKLDNAIDQAHRIRERTR